MDVRELFATSLRSLGSHKLRSGLTLLGVIIGVMTVVAVVSVISGLNEFVATNLINLNPDVLVFTKFGILRSRSEFLMANRRKPLTMVERRLVEANCRSCAAVGAQASQTALVKAGRRKLGAFAGRSPGPLATLGGGSRFTSFSVRMTFSPLTFMVSTRTTSSPTRRTKSTSWGGSP